MNKKTYSLIAVFAALLYFSVANAQSQLWINYYDGVDRIDLDGSGFTQGTAHPSTPSPYNIKVSAQNQYLLKASDGSIYGLNANNTGAYYKESMFRITASGRTTIHEFNLNEQF